MNKLITASRDKESSITIAEGKKQSVILKSEAKASEMQINAEARAKQTKIDAAARAERTKIDADAEAERISKITEAETARTKEINQAISDSKLNEQMIAYLRIEAFKQVVESDTNTVIMPSNMTELGNIPVAKELWNKTDK